MFILKQFVSSKCFSENIRFVPKWSEDPDDGLKWPVAFYDRNGVGGAKWAKNFLPQMIVLSN